MQPILFSKIYGSGKPLIILHGLLGMGDNWATLAKKFSKTFEVHVIDQRNHGRSFHSNSWSYDDMVHDLKEYILYHKLEDINILGHSMGGKTAMFFATSNPYMVDKLIVADIAPKEYPVSHNLIIDAVDSLDFNYIKSRTQADEELSKQISDWGIRQFILKNLYWKEKDRLGIRFNIDVIKRDIENIGIPLSPMAYFDGPTLFLDGEKSDYINSSDSSLIDKHFPNNKIIEIANAGHWLHAEQPKEFFDNSLSFLMED